MRQYLHLPGGTKERKLNTAVRIADLWVTTLKPPSSKYIARVLVVTG
jgi:hypothetical protein